MQVFKCALRVIFRNPVYLLVYVVGLSFMGVAMASSYTFDAPAEYERAQVEYAVIDRDNSALSSGVADFLATQGTAVEIEDNELAMQDAVAKGEVSYMLIVPENWGEKFLEAARSDEELPQMDVVYSYSSAEGALADSALANYIGALQIYALTEPDAEASAISDKALKASLNVSNVEAENTQASVEKSDQYAFYLSFGSYGLFASIIACCGILISTLNRTDVRKRNLSSPMSLFACNMQTALACLVVVLIVWTWTFTLGAVVFGESLAAAGVLGALMMGLVLFAFALIPLGVAFLLGNLGAGPTMLNAVGNIAGLVVSFLGGAWISLSLMSPEVLAVAKFLPGYWFTTAITEASHIGIGSADAFVNIFGHIGILLLFAAVFFLAGLVIGRFRIQTDSAGGNAGAELAVEIR